MMLHTCCMSSCFWFKLDCIILRFKAKIRTVWLYLCKMMLHKTYLNETKTADGLNEMQIHSLTAGSAYGTAAIQHFLGYRCKQNSAVQGLAETFGGAGAQSIKGAHGTQLLIGLCSLLICVSKWMLLYWYSSKCHDAGLKKKPKTEKTILSLLWNDIIIIIIIIIIVVIVFTGYGGFAVVNTTVVVVVEKKIFLSYLK